METLRVHLDATDISNAPLRILLRSLHDVMIDLGEQTVATGANGSGKSSLYRALRCFRT